MDVPRVGATWQKRMEQEKLRDSLMDQLRALDAQRDALRAAIADADLLCAKPPWGITGTEKESIWVAEQQAKVDRRAARRVWEKARYGTIPPGPWDEDLDKHQGNVIAWDLGDGYSGRLNRNGNAGWNYYITVPAGHALWGKDYEDPEVPCRFTYSAEEGCGGWTFGHCHDAEGGDVVPKHHYRVYRADEHYSGEPRGRLISLPSLAPVPFLTAEAVQEEVARIKKRLMPPDLLAAQEAREAAAAAAGQAEREAEFEALMARLRAEQEAADKAAKSKMSWAQIAAAPPSGARR